VTRSAADPPGAAQHGEHANAAAAPAPTTIWLVRHGSVHNPRQILYGRLPRFRLTTRGVAEARAAGQALAATRPAALFSSPLLRARQSAREILALHSGLRLRTSLLLTEVHTPFEGLPGREVDARHGDVYSGAGQAYEQPPDVLARLLAFVRRVRCRFAGRAVIAVTHGDPIVFAMLWARGLAASAGNKARLRRLGLARGYPATGSLTSLAFHSARPDERPSIEYLEPDVDYRGASTR
jgi:broad specificity phosphatase PhoE